MRGTLRRERTDLWAWAYLVLFGAGEDAARADEKEAESTAVPESDDGPEGVPPSESE
jgi:hypothetical protein